MKYLVLLVCWLSWYEKLDRFCVYDRFEILTILYMVNSSIRLCSVFNMFVINKIMFIFLIEWECSLFE